MSNEIAGMWSELDGLYEKAEDSVRKTAEDIWEFYHEVATSALGHTYGDRMEYYGVVAGRYEVSVATVRLWVREGKRDKDDFLTRGKLSSIAWKEKKRLEEENAKAVAIDDEAVLDDAVADLLAADGGSYGEPDVAPVDAFYDVDDDTELLPASRSPMQDFSSMTDELEGWRSLGFATPAAARVELVKLRERLEESKQAALTREDFNTISEVAVRRVTDLREVAKIQRVLNKLEPLVG